jgi:D-serine deaminase-like pyridoxal phosphate-dependent protein
MADALPDTRDYARWRTLLSGARLPAAIVDLDALEANLATLLAALDDTDLTLRIATKSIRCTAVLRHLVERGAPRVRGLMTFSAHETALLADLGFDDFLCAYPVGRRDEAAVFGKLAAEGRYAVAMVDDPHHIRLLAEAAEEHGVEIPVCIDLDVSWRPAGDLHFGVRRSPLRDSEQVRALGKIVGDTAGVRLDGLMAYEAQVAGLRDRTPGSRLLDPVRGVIKSQSRPLAADRRMAARAALSEEGFALALVNGGGTGSIRSTSQDPSVTEVTAGSGFFCPHLFDGYRDLALAPAAFFALSVVRMSDANHVTCAGGGYVASGQVGPDRLPLVHAPPGLKPVDIEGFGEVQTPFEVTGELRPDIGDPVVCRHAKAGELLERFDEVLLVRGDTIEAVVPTYRGLGGSFF